MVRTIDTNCTLSAYQWRGVWGERQTGTLQPGKGYCANLGHQEDETGLVYMRARYYEPTTGRFITEDPARDGMNWYLYADGNPVNWIDISGNVKEKPIPGMSGWTYRVDRRYQAGINPDGSIRYLQDVALSYKGNEMGSVVIEESRWKHGPNGHIPKKVIRWFNGRFGTTLATCSVVAYFQQDPLDFIAIMLDIAGEHEEAAFLDRLNRGEL